MKSFESRGFQRLDNDRSRRFADLHVILRIKKMPQISPTEFYALPLRVHTFLADVPLHDVWAVDLGDRGSIIVYNAQFEFQRLSELASWLPEFSGWIESIQRRLWDLLPIVRNHVYHPQFGGSYSLKSVLPALVPEMTYEGMEVADGQAAGLAWESLVRGTAEGVDRDRIRKALLEYCS
jgi:hypothetical protein